MYVCVYIYICIHKYTCLYDHTLVYTITHIYTDTDTCAHTLTCIYIRIPGRRLTSFPPSDPFMPLPHFFAAFSMGGWSSGRNCKGLPALVSAMRIARVGARLKPMTRGRLGGARHVQAPIFPRCQSWPPPSSSAVACFWPSPQDRGKRVAALRRRGEGGGYREGCPPPRSIAPGLLER